MNIIAFDLGGSGGKLFLGQYDEGKLKLTTVHRFAHSATELNGNLYWDLLRIHQELCEGIKEAVRLTDDDIEALGIDTYCNDFALVSPEGELVTQMHSYRDSRTIRKREQIYHIMSPDELYAVNGNQNAPFNTLMQIGAMVLSQQRYLLENNKMLFLPDLLIYFLSGKMFHEYTLASVSQMFDYAKKDWCRKILESYGIPDTLFSEIVYPGTINCQTSDETNKRLHTKGFPIVTVCEHDTASAFLASVYEKECAIISCGTWALIGTETKEPIITEYGFRYNIANEGGFDGHHRILKNVMGTWLIQELCADLRSRGEEYSYAELEKESSKAEAFAYLIDVDDELFYTPGNMIKKLQDKCKSYYGKQPERPGEFARCIYESLALKYRWCLEKLHHLTGVEFRYVNLLGGGAQSGLMCQFTANATGLAVAAGPVEATALGNMIVQLAALKKITSIEEGRRIIRNSFDIREYRPEMTAEWDKQYNEFKEMFHLE